MMKLGWTPTVNGTRLCVLKSSFKGKYCGRCKLESAHNSSAPYLYSQELMGNASWFPSLFTKPRSTPNISITTSQWTGQSITHHLATWIETSGLSLWPNSPTYAAHLLSTIRYSSSMDKVFTLTTAHWYKWKVKTSSSSYLNWVAQSTAMPMTTGLTIKWRLFKNFEG